MLALMLISIGIIFRFIPHAPNFTPVAAIALFGAMNLPNRRLSLIMPLALMIVSDLFLGMHDMVAFTWGATVLVSLIGISLKKSNKTTAALGGSLAASLVFFVVTNFGVWAMGWYPQTGAGLAQCYIAAVPFFRNFLAGTLIYSVALFGAYAIAARSLKNTKLAPALLSR
jgi:hypothetical protein